MTTALKTLIFTVIVPGTVAILVPYRVLSSPVTRGTLAIAYVGLAFLFMHAFVMLYEEPALKRKFGESYTRYRDLVPRWIPQLSALTELKGEV